MADISKIKLPNGNEYNIKDTTARATGKVSGIKGNKQSSYRTGNVNLTADNIGAFEKKPYENGTIEIGIRPFIDQARANRLSFLPANQIIVEKTIDGGQTWQDANLSDSQKVGLFVSGGSMQIPLLNEAKSILCGVRITITGMKYNVPEGTIETEKYDYWNSSYVLSQERYFNVREWWFWLSSNNDTIKPQIYCATGANPNNWITVFNQDFRMNGWSGSDWIRTGDGKTFGGSINQTGNYWNWRIIFWSSPQNGKTEFLSNTIQTIQQIRCYGDSVWGMTTNNLGKNDHLYSYDTAQNATFPAKVLAKQFISNGKAVLTGGSNAASTVAITPTTTDVYSMTSVGSITAGTANIPTQVDISKFNGGAFTEGTFSQGTLPTLAFTMDTTDTKKLNITFNQGTLPTHAADSFTPAALQSGFYTAGTPNTPTAVTLPGRSSVIKAWTGYSSATAAAQTFTGSSN